MLHCSARATHCPRALTVADLTQRRSREAVNLQAKKGELGR
jgi:hypothetical protein